MNDGKWLGQIQRLKDLLRVPVQGEEQGVRQERKADIEQLSNYLSYLLFGGYQDWFDQDDGWLLLSMAQCLTDEKDAQLLGLLRAGDEAMLLTFLSDTCVPEWRASAERRAARGQAGAGQAGAGGDGAEEVLVGAENSANWNVSRTPGTYYYAYDGSEYLYCDQQRAPAADWRALPERERAATENARPWGAGWCTPTYGAPQYDSAYVFATAYDGPWLTRDAAAAQLEQIAAQPGQTAEPEPEVAAEPEPAEREAAIRSLAQQALEQRPALVSIPERRRLELAALVVDERRLRTGRWSA
jgi:hypothetical protein